MPDHTDDINSKKIVFDDQNFERRLWSCLGQTCSRSLIVFLSQFFVIFLTICSCFWRIHLAKTWWRINSLGRNLVHCSGIHFTITKFLNKIFSTKNRIFISLAGPSDFGKTYLIHEWLKVGTFQPKLDKTYFFSQHLQPICDVMQTCKKKLITLSLFKVYTSNLSNRWKKTVPSVCSILMAHVQKFATVRSLCTLLLPADIADLVP